MIALAMAVALADVDAAPAVPRPPPAALMQQLRLQCRDADAVLPTLSKGLEAEKAKDLTAAKSEFEAVISNCGASRAADPPRVFRAEIAWREHDYPGVLAWLKGVPHIGPSRINLMASMLAMEADRQLGDNTAFVSERAAVEAAEQNALGAKGRRLDSFDVKGARVVAYDTPLSQGAFHRIIEFTVSPTDPTAMPESLMLTDDVQTRAMMKAMKSDDRGAPYFLDAYTCLSHVTVKLLPGHGEAPPTYDEVKPLVINYLTSKTWSSMLTPDATTACAWPQFVAPGITN